jgi:hypothetical protein
VPSPAQLFRHGEIVNPSSTCTIDRELPNGFQLGIWIADSRSIAARSILVLSGDKGEVAQVSPELIACQRAPGSDLYGPRFGSLEYFFLFATRQGPSALMTDGNHDTVVPKRLILSNALTACPTDEIDKNTGEIRPKNDETYSNMMDLADELPETTPQFIVLSHPLTLVSRPHRSSWISVHDTDALVCSFRRTAVSPSLMSSSTTSPRTARQTPCISTPTQWS